MTRGIPVSRSIVFFLKSGEAVIDWGDGRAQDLWTGEFYPLDESQFDRAISDADLANLRNNGRIEGFDARTVYLRALPEPPRSTID
jgi:hypothetical protein